MASTRLFVDGFELKVVKNTLTLKQDYSGFSNSFTVPRSNNPFLIVKDQDSERLLNVHTLQSVNRKLSIDCKVQQGNIIYPGRLTVNQVNAHTIKCDVSFYSNIFSLLRKKIRQYMPVIKVGDTTLTEYESTSDIDINDTDWDDFSLENKYNSYPEDDFCLPWISAPDRYGENLNEDNEWFYYAKTINRYFAGSGEIVRNFFADADFDNNSETPVERRYFNRNVVVPCVFILAPIRAALSVLNYKLTGTFTEQPEIQAIHHISAEDQLVEIGAQIEPVELTFTGKEFDPFASFLVPSNVVDADPVTVTYEFDTITVQYQVNQVGSYNVDIDIDATNSNYQDRITVVYVHLANNDEQRFINSVGVNNEGRLLLSVTIDVNLEDLGKFIIVRYLQISDIDIVPVISTVDITYDQTSNSLFKFHPVIELGRFIPDVTTAEYINWLINWHNLRLTIDDVSQTVSLDFNEDFILDPSNVAIKNYKVVPFTPAPNPSFEITYSGEDAERLLITRESVSPTALADDFTKKIPLKTKLTPHNGETYEVLKDFLSGSGYPVAYFNSTSDIPYGVTEVNNKTLALTGDKGVYQSRYKTWLKFRINASAQEISLAVSTFELEDIREKGKVFFNNQLYVIKSQKEKEVLNGLQVTLFLESVNF